MAHSSDPPDRFLAIILRPADAGEREWGFVVLPREIDERLPRRGRTTVAGTIGPEPFRATLEPDGQLGHWLRLAPEVLQAAGVKVGEQVEIELASVDEPEPRLPEDFRLALEGNAKAREVWAATTVLARVDWIHWIESATKAATRSKRVAAACDKLAQGQKRVCCFDPSGYYSKAFSAPRVAE